MRFRHGLLSFGLAALAGCATQEPKVTVPRVVETVVPTYVPIPAELTQRCPISLPRNKTVGEAVRVARARRAALAKCNAQLKAIREIQGKAADR